MVKRFFLMYKALFVLLTGIVAIVILYFIFIKLGIITKVPDEVNIIKNDAVWFNEIRYLGYTFTPNQKSNMAFFPLFPYLWKWTFLDNFHIIFLNLAIFIISFLILIGKTNYKTSYLMIVSTIPCFIFFFLPYSEACFFLFGTLLILGYRRDSKALIFVGLFGCCLTRSVSIFFIPAVIITELLAYKSSGISRKKLLIDIITNILICVISIFIVVLIQWIETGKWFYYIEVQKHWKREWLIPSIPFTTISPNKVLGIDAIGLMLGCIAIFFCCKWGYSCLVSEQRRSGLNGKNDQVCKSVYFSALFLSAIAIIDTCFTYNIEGSTNMQCMNRHLMCTSFAVCFLNWINKDYNPRSGDVYFIIAILLSGIFVTGVFNYMHHTVYYILFGLSFFLYKFFQKSQPWYFILFLFNIFFTVIFYHDFISGFWIG